MAKSAGKAKGKLSGHKGKALPKKTSKKKADMKAKGHQSKKFGDKKTRKGKAIRGRTM